MNLFWREVPQSGKFLYLTELEEDEFKKCKHLNKNLRRLRGIPEPPKPILNIGMVAKPDSWYQCYLSQALNDGIERRFEKEKDAIECLEKIASELIADLQSK